MLKFLFAVAINMVFFIGAYAQTSTDTTVKHKDTTAKLPVTDTVTKHAHQDTTAKAPVGDTIEHSPVKTLSDKRYNAYVKGEDLDDMSLAGELNHYPLPDKVLKFKKELDLSPIQVGQLKGLATKLQRKRLEMGVVIIRNEKVLDGLFRTNRLDEGSIIFYTNRSGLYYGELKGAILLACFNTQKLLTDAQVKKLDGLEKTN
jgi:hypothetical protein